MLVKSMLTADCLGCHILQSTDQSKWSPPSKQNPIYATSICSNFGIGPSLANYSYTPMLGDIKPQFICFHQNLI